MDTFELKEGEAENMVLKVKALYAFMAITMLVLSAVSYNAYKANNEANKTRNDIKIITSSSGASIQKLMNGIEENKKQWTMQQQIVDNAYNVARIAEEKQNMLNEDTEKKKEALKQYNISLIN